MQLITDNKIVPITLKLEQKASEYKNWRDEMIKKAVKDINLLRKGTKFENKIETPAQLAIRINRNFFLKDDGELNLVLKNCENKRNYGHLYWLLRTDINIKSKIARLRNNGQ